MNHNSVGSGGRAQGTCRPSQALYFLWKSQLRNNFKRTATSPRRLLTVIVFVAYVSIMLVTWITGITKTSSHSIQTKQELLRIIPFTILGALWLIALMGISSFGSTFQLAEIEVLFPTPIPQKSVFGYRILRTLAANLALTLFLRVVYGIRNAFVFNSTTVNHVPIANFVNVLFLAMILQAVLSTCLGYCYAIFLRRDTPLVAKIEKAVQWAIAAIILGTGVTTWFLVLHLGALNGLNLMTNNPLVKVVLFPAQFGTWMVLSPIYGLQWLAFGLLGYVLISGAAFYFSATNLDWFYDISARRADVLGKRIQLQRSGNIRGLTQEMIKSGKIKARGRRLGENIRVQGNASFVWREIVLAARRSPFVTGIIIVVGTFYGSIPVIVFGLSNSDLPYHYHPEVTLAMLMGMQALGIFYAMAILIQSGIPYFIAQTELIKSLPFSCTRILAMEVISKAWLPVIIVPISCIVDVIVQPSSVEVAFAALIFSPTVSFLFSSIWYFAYLVLPDYGDAAQRLLRGLLAMAIVVVASTPVVGALVLGYLVGGPILCGILGATVAAAITVGFVYLDGRQYENLVLSE